MSVKSDAFPASEAFDLINQVLNNNPGERKEAIKQGDCIFAFTLTNDKSETESWYIDLKTTGTAGKGLAPAGKKPTVIISLSDANFAGLISGKANSQKLFMSGELKVKGSVMKAMKMEPVLKKARTRANL